MWKKLREILERLFGRGSNKPASRKPAGVTEPWAQPSAAMAGTISYFSNQETVQRFSQFTKLPNHVRNTEAGDAVRQGYLENTQKDNGLKVRKIDDQTVCVTNTRRPVLISSRKSN